MIKYYLNNKDSFYSVRKSYTLRLGKKNGTVNISKENKMSHNEEEYHLDSSKLLPVHITSNVVYEQLANTGQIVFEVTDACNLQCTYCVYRELYTDYDKRINQYIDPVKAKMLIDFLVEKLQTPSNNSPHKKVTVGFYGGEPLLNMDFIMDIVSYTKQRETEYLTFKYMMTTNGVLLKKHLDFFVKYDFEIMVSLDGSKENNAYRLYHNGKSSFDTVYENMIYIRDNYPVFFSNNILFNTVIHSLNNRQEAFCFFQKEFNKTPLFSSVSDVSIRRGFEKEMNALTAPKQSVQDDELEAKMEKVMEFKYNKIEKLQRFIFLYSGNVFYDYNDLLLKKNKQLFISNGTCIPFSRKVFMTVNNKLLPCEKIGHQYSLGKVTDTGVEIDCESIAQKYNYYFDLLINKCRGCHINRQCPQCLFGINNLEKKPVCKNFFSKQTSSDYLHGNIEQLSQRPELYKRIIEEFTKI
ncbi:MAG: radical SAM peptide maturase [Tannerella sp.]|jgi:uncharacterized protein|nr:radical SAM peptide maturase [Tannerella sp.]